MLYKSSYINNIKFYKYKGIYISKVCYINQAISIKYAT